MEIVLDNPKTKNNILTKFTNAQLEILSFFNMTISESEMVELKKILANFAASLAQRKIDLLYDEGKYPSAVEIQKIHHK
ncbi:MAG: hypothetical protein II956_03915 [Bacteroidales bacterium]|nr:hypothetical protein [Bacteroidales bacterium]